VVSNLLVATGKIRLEGVNAVRDWSGNIFYSGSNVVEQVELRDYSGVRTINTAPAGVVTTDTPPTDSRRGSIGWRSDSPAVKLGIHLDGFRTAGTLGWLRVIEEPRQLPGSH